jgi:hypothetical protein
MSLLQTPANNVIRKISPSVDGNGKVETFAGNRNPGLMDGEKSFAIFQNPIGIIFGIDKSLFVADSENNHVIRKIDMITGVVSTFAGTGELGYLDGDVKLATFDTPYGLAMDLNDNLYVADTENHLIRKILANGIIATLAGSARISDSTNAIGTLARLNHSENFYCLYGMF